VNRTQSGGRTAALWGLRCKRARVTIRSNVSHSSSPPRVGLARAVDGPGTAIGVAILAVLLAVLLAGCQDNVATEFPDGLEPLEDNMVPVPQGGTPTEGISFVTGENDYKWVHGRGYILADPATVWAATKDPERMAATCSTDRHTVMLGLEPQYEYGFQLHYEVDQVITVAWDESWRYGTVLGTPATPELAIIRYQKVFGSDFISLLEGSIQVLATDQPGVTEMQFIEHLSALGGSAGQMQDAMQHRFDIVAAVAHGQPLPACP